MGISASTLINNPQSYASPAGQKPKEYDYIIVGGGTAGCVLANRLSEDPNVSVLVLEAGGTNNVLESKAPIAFSKLFHTDKDWDYYTTPQSSVDGREQYWPRGKLLGGSSSINAMMAHQAAPSDYDEWEQEFGCKGWGYEGMKPYFRRMEGFSANPSRPAIDLAHRGQEGFVRTGYSYLSEIGEKGFIPACESVGIPLNPDLNTVAGTEGVSRIITYIDPKTGSRSSAATAYLPPSVQSRQNLTIATEVRVSKILFDQSSGSEPVAVGCELQTSENGPLFQVKARREVILCGGAIATPQILILSGIGPEAELKKHGIKPVKVNENVGNNMRDHFCCTPLVAKTKPGISLDYLGNDIKAIPSLVRWLLTGTGPFTSNVGEVASFVRSNDDKVFDPKLRNSKFHGSLGKGPDLELIATPMAFLDHGATPAPDGGVMSLVPIGLRPRSVGSITVKSTNIFDKAIIDPKYWTDEGNNDFKVLLEGMRVCLKILQQPSLKKYFDLDSVKKTEDPKDFYWPWAAPDYSKITDQQLKEWMPKKAFTLYHPVSTARMGTDESNSVVDYKDLKVWGVKGLRVVDASIFPEQIAGHPTAAVYSTAEKASDIIRGVAPTIDGQGVTKLSQPHL